MKSTSRHYIFLILTVCIVMLAGVAFSAYASVQNFNASFDAVDGVLSFSGSTGVSNELLTVTLLPEGSELGSDELSVENSILKSVRTESGGSFNCELEISDKLGSNAYILRVRGMHSGFDKTYPLSYISPTASASAFAELKKCVDDKDYSGFRTCLVTNSLTLGINPGKVTENDIYSKLLYAHTPSTGYDIGSFYTSQRYASAITDIRNITDNHADNLDTVITAYSDELHADTVHYAGVSDDAKKAFADRVALMDENTLVKSDAETLYFETMFLSELDASSNYTEFKAVVTDYADATDLDMRRYNSSKLSDSDRNTVFKKMYGTKYMSIADVADDFEKNVDSLYSESESTGGSNGSGSRGSGSGGFMSANGITIPTDTETPVQPDNNKISSAYLDITNHWAKNYITALSAKGVVSGYGNNLFMPDNSITRAEFTKLVCESFGIAKSDEVIFADVASDAWYFGYVSGAFKAGIINGYNGEFNPDDNIKREDAAVIICNALKHSGTAVYESNVSYNDSSDISYYALYAAGYLQQEGIMEGSDGYFNPKSNTTRAEAATLLCRILKLEV